MSTLSKAAEGKLLSAIEAAAEFVNKGLSPNEAIIKSATQHNIPPGHLDLMVHAYNTGRTTTQREIGASTLDKAANFPVADATAIKQSLFSSEVKTSAEIAGSAAISFDYAVTPNGWLNRMAKKSSALRAELEKKDRVKVAHENSVMPSLYSQKMAKQRDTEERRRVVTDLYYKTAMKFEALAEYFKTAGHATYGDVIEDSAIVHGEHGVLVLKKLAGLYPELEKQAATGATTLADTTPRKLVAEVLDCVDAYNKAAAAFYATEAADAGPAADRLVNLQPHGARNSILPEYPSPYAHKIPDEKQAGLNPPMSRARGRAGFFNGAVPPDMTLQSMLLKASASTARVFERDPTAPFDSPGGYRTYVLDQDGNSVHSLGDLEPARVDRPRTSTTRVYRAAEGDRPAGHQSILIDETGRELSQLGDVEPERARETGGGGFDGVGAGADMGRGIVSGLQNLSPMGLVSRVAERIGDADMPDPKAVAAKTLNQISGAEQDKALRDIKSRSVMHDLIMNDPVISSHEPEEVAMAFNDIAELAPSMVDSPGMLRVILRKRLEAGQLADFDVKQIMEMDKLRAERDKLVNEGRRINKELI